MLGRLKQNRNKTKAALILVFTLTAMLYGCGKEAFSQEVLLSSETGTVESALSDCDADNDVTPYQFLYLMRGNAEELSFRCTVLNHGADDLNPDSDDLQTRHFQKRGDVCIESFTALDMNGNLISVRELETDGKVCYILDDSKIVKIYLAPAEDFLMYQMLTAAETMPTGIVREGEYVIYEHRLYPVQDEDLYLDYSFFMQNGVLKKLTVALNGAEETSYYFSDFQQTISDQTAFLYPEGYLEEAFDYGYTGEHAPPWWEIGNDE